MSNTFTTALARELYELVLGDGATLAAIRDMPGLMGLAYISAEAPSVEEDAHDDAVAATVRAFIEQATYALEEPLSERDDKDADRGATARCLLGLHRGTGSMLLKERRKLAAGYLIKSVRTMSKRRDRKGRIVSHEMLLMDQLASELWDRESDFLKGNQASPSEPASAPDLTGVSELWSVTGSLSSQIWTFIWETLRPELADEYPETAEESLLLLGRFWQLVRVPSKKDHPSDDHLDPRLRAAIYASPTATVAALYDLTPFGEETIALMAQTDFRAAGHTSPAFVYDLLAQWRAWLKLCTCGLAKPQAECPVHRFKAYLGNYKELLDECWRELRDPYHSPLSYKICATPAEILEFYAICPDIDKYT